MKLISYTKNGIIYIKIAIIYKNPDWTAQREHDSQDKTVESMTD